MKPLAIAVLSNEREGLRQIESAIREIQSVVEGTQPQNRRATIARFEQELDGLRKRVAAIDQELDAIASAHLTKIGPRGETPADLALRVVAERDAFGGLWTDLCVSRRRPALRTELSRRCSKRERRCGDLIDYLKAKLPSPLDLPDTDTVACWHDDLIAAAEHGEAAEYGPARALRINAENATRRNALGADAR